MYIVNKTSQLLGILCNEYKNNPKHYILKCISCYMKNEEFIKIIKTFNGYNLLFDILNYKHLLTDESFYNIISILKETSLTKEEEKKLIDIMNCENKTTDKYIKKLTAFYYPGKKCNFCGKFKIKPFYDGELCSFSITPFLKYIQINERNGEIFSSSKEQVYANKEKKRYRDYTIRCTNLLDSLSYKLKMKYKKVGFVQENSSTEITISDDSMIYTSCSCCSYCFLDVDIKKSKYYIKFKSSKECSFSFNLTSDINDISEAIKFLVDKDGSFKIRNAFGTIATVKPDFMIHKENAFYEAIIDMTSNQFFISQNDCDPVLLVKDLTSPLFPFFKIEETNVSIELLSVVIYD